MSDINEIRKAKLKMAATLRAQFNWETALARIDHKLDIIEPALAKIELDAAKGIVPVIEAK